MKNQIQPPLIIFIIGTTASGKTKLSLELAQKYSGEIIRQKNNFSSDSMQFYKGADILTAKVTQQEQKLAKHHMIDLLDLTDKGNQQNLGYTRNDYFFQAMEIIDDIVKRGKVPIIIGGTHYYTETLIFKQNILQHGQQEKGHQERKKYIDDQQNLSLHDILETIDPIMANRLHPQDDRKIKTYLDIYVETGKKPSEFIQQNDIGELRFQNTVIFQPKFKDNEILLQKTEKRIKEMLDIDGLSEIINVTKAVKPFMDQNKGVYQAIGYKEFEPFYEQVKDTNNLNKDLENKTIKKILSDCTERLIINTFKYCKQQLKWIKNRLYNCQSTRSRIFTMQFEHENQFPQALQRAFQIMDIIKSILLIQDDGDFEKNLNQSRQKFEENCIKDDLIIPNRVKVENWKKFECIICNKFIDGEQVWEKHLSSKKHKKIVASQNKKLEKQKQQIQQLNQDTIND